jgi:AcrR family transcriptional regulator
VGLLYRHFKTKEDIFGALLEKAIADMKTFGTMTEGNIPPEVLIRMSASMIMENINKSDEYVQFQKLLSRAADDIPDSLPQMLEYSQELQGKLTHLIKRGQKNGTFRQGNAKSMAHLFLATIQGLCAWKLAAKDSYAPPAPAMLTAFLLKEEYNIYD